MYENAIMVGDKTRIIRKEKKDGKKELFFYVLRWLCH
jgi:hypothetical protein